MNWTDAMVADLKALWDKGESATLIAAAFGNVSRNAVLGKVHRLGLSHRHTMVSKPMGRISDKPRLSRSKTAVAIRIAAKLNVQRPAKSVQKIIKPNAQTFSFKTALPELTKNQLRAQLTQAVINTAAMQ
jgi:hypothetical protein